MSSESLPTASSSLNGPRRPRLLRPVAPVPAAAPPPPGELTAHLTDDLFLGAYLVAEGAQLTGTELEARPGCGRVVSFVIEAASDELAVLESAYARGEALTNVLRFKAALTHLKDVMFARLREARRLDARR